MSTTPLKRLLGRLPRAAPSRTPRQVILLYHSVGDSPWAMPEKLFRSQLDWLCRAVKVMSLGDLLEAGDAAPLQAAITFDDGYASVADIVFPVMRDHGVGGTLHINTGLIGQAERIGSDANLGHYPNESFLLWREIDALVASRWTIGSHGVDHLDFTAQSDAVAEQQLRESKIVIENRLSLPCRYFAYTLGKHTRRLERIVEGTGYHYGLTGEHAPVPLGCDPMTVPRISISRDYALDDFKAIVSGDWDYIGQIQKIRRYFA